MSRKETEAPTQQNGTLQGTFQRQNSGLEGAIADYEILRGWVRMP